MKIRAIHTVFALAALTLAVLCSRAIYALEQHKTETEGSTREAGIEPHKALYEINLAATKSSSQIVNIDGQMLYEWQPSCEAWNSKHRFNLMYEYADAPPLKITSDFSTFETFDGQSLDFTSQRKKDNRVFEEVRGRAQRNVEAEKENKTAAGEASYTLPDGLSYDLAEGTLFPMQHTLMLLEKAQQGTKFFTSTMFDGSDEDGPVEVNAFIRANTGKAKLVKASTGLDQELLSGKSWKIRLAFFPLTRREETPDYEMEIVFHENGVISEMLVEYDDFSITQSLMALERLKDTCL